MAALNEGGIIHVDIPERKLWVELHDEEIAARLAQLPPCAAKIKNGCLARYVSMVTSANTGAVLQIP